MPTYQYRCTECGHDLEAVQKFSDASLTECPSCGGQLRKIFNAVGVVFKGSGFYRTDSRTGSDGGSSEKSSVDAGGKDSASKDSGGKDSGSKDAGGKDAKKPGTGDAGSTPAKADAPRSESAKPAAKTPASTGSKPASS